MKVFLDKNENQYMFANGKLPRGKGYWAFKIVASLKNGDLKVFEDLLFINCNLSDAKNEIKKALEKNDQIKSVLATVQT